MSQKHRFRISENFGIFLQRLEAFEDRVSARVWENPLTKRILPYLRGVLIYLIYALMLLFCMPFLRIYFAASATYFNYPNLVLAILEILLPVFLARSVILTFSIYSRYERIDFLARADENTLEENEKARLLRQKNFWIEAGIFFLLYLLHPISWGHDGILHLFPPSMSWNPLLQKLLSLLIMPAVSVYFHLTMRIEAMNTWLEAPEKIAKKARFRSKAKARKKHFSLVRMFGRLLLNFLVFALICRTGPVALALMGTVFRLFLMMFLELWFRIVLYVLFVSLVFKIFFKRVRMIAKLKKICKENGFRIFRLKHVYLSVLYNGFSSYQVGIEANGKIYCCRLVSCLRRGNDMYFTSHTLRCIRVFVFRMRMPVVVRAGGFASMSRDTANPTDLINFIISSRKFSFDAENNAQKILILNPVPVKVYRTDVDVISERTSEEIDNGMDVGEYKVFTGGAFMRALERNSVEEILPKKSR